MDSIVYSLYKHHGVGIVVYKQLCNFVLKKHQLQSTVLVI